MVFYIPRRGQRFRGTVAPALAPTLAPALAPAASRMANVYAVNHEGASALTRSIAGRRTRGERPPPHGPGRARAAPGASTPGVAPPSSVCTSSCLTRAVREALCVSRPRLAAGTAAPRALSREAAHAGGSSRAQTAFAPCATSAVRRNRIAHRSCSTHAPSATRQTTC